MAYAIMTTDQCGDAGLLYQDAISAAPCIAANDLKNLALCYRHSGNERAALKAEYLAAQGE